MLDFESANNRLDVTVQVIGSNPGVNAPLRIMLNDVPEPPDRGDAEPSGDLIG